MDPKLLAILVCPITKTKLVYDKKQQALISTAAKLAFPVRDGIPIMLENEAHKMSAEEVEMYSKKKS
jgi:uncharacterized protein YbaR (Trm112 family)